MESPVIVSSRNLEYNFFYKQYPLHATAEINFKKIVLIFFFSVLKRSENNFESVIQEESTKNFSSTMDQEFCIDHQHQNLNSVTSTGLSSYPIGSVDSYGCYPSNLIQSLFDSQPQPQNSLFTNPSSMSYSSSSMTKQQLSGLHFSNNTPFWNASAEALNDIRAGVLASSQSQYQSPNFQNTNFSSSNTLLNKVYNLLI